MYARQSIHRAAAAPLDSLPQNGAVVTLRAVCGWTHRENYVDIALIAIVGRSSLSRR
jgi:hypothetical protein